MNGFFVVITIAGAMLVPSVAVLYFPEYGLTPIAWLSFVAARLTGTTCEMVFMYLRNDGPR